MRTRLLASVIGSCLLGACLPAHAQFIFGRIVPSLPEVEANGPSTSVDVSADGKVLVFASLATNWTPAGPVGSKIIAADLVPDTIESLAFTSAGVALNANNFAPVASHDGRFVAFTTQANNLDVGVATSGSQIVRKDRVTGTLQLASASAAGTPASGSASGQARDSSISGDGRFVVFRSDAANLVAGDLAGTGDAFVKDLTSGAIEAVSRDVNGAFTAAGILALTSHAISSDGRYVVFQSAAANLAMGVGGGTILVYVRDRTLGTTSVASLDSLGTPANSQSDNAAISPGGRFVSFRSFATNLGGGSGSRVFVHDRVAGTTAAVPFPSVDGAPANGCRESDVSDAGTVMLTCFFPTPIPDQVFLHIPGASGTPFLISSNAGDVRGNQSSGASLAIDSSGLSMTFESLADNLAASDANGASDIFVLIDAALLNRIFADGFED